MNLQELIAKTTPGKWTIDKSGDVRIVDGIRDKICLVGFSMAMGRNPQAEANNLYVYHCAKVLPELVAALGKAEYCLDYANAEIVTAADMHNAFEAVKSALKLANEIKP